MDRPTSKLVPAGLIALMALGSLMLWIGIPVGWLWLGSKLQHGSQPSMGPYLVVIAGVIASMVVVGKLLASLDRTYARVTRTDAQVRVRLPWHRSMRGERDPVTPHSVLNVVMVATVAAAFTTFVVWFFIFAGSSLPT